MSLLPGIALGHDLTDDEIVLFATDVSRLTGVTEEPHQMADSTAALCVTIPRAQHKIHDGFAEPAYCHVYVNTTARAVIMAGKGRYPAGSLIVKSKFRNKDASEKIELYTVMRKRDVGYDTKNGDWEYSVVDGRTRRVLARGTIESCINCHAEYKSTDYVTREYLTADDGEP